MTPYLSVSCFCAFVLAALPAAADEPKPTDLKEIQTRLAQNLRETDERLNDKKDASEETAQIQRDIIKDLDTLIEQSRQRQQQPQQPHAGGSPTQPRSQRPQPDAGGGADRGQQPRAERNSKPSNQPQPNPRGNQPPSKDSRAQANKIADLYKDHWGDLPPTLRQDMDQYSREEFMPKYSEMLKKYYSTLSEKQRQ